MQGKCGQKQHRDPEAGSRSCFNAGLPPLSRSPFPRTHAEPGKRRCPAAGRAPRPSREARWPPNSPGTRTLPAAHRGEGGARHLLGLRKHSVSLRKQLALLEGPSSMSAPKSSEDAATRAAPAPRGHRGVRPPPPRLGPGPEPGQPPPAPGKPWEPARRTAGPSGSRGGGGGGRGPARAGSSKPWSAGERKSRRRPPPR